MYVSSGGGCCFSEKKENKRKEGGRAGEELKSSSRFHLPLLMVFSYQLCLLSLSLVRVQRRRFLAPLFFALFRTHNQLRSARSLYIEGMDAR
jgi:hypothetical protein